MEKGFSPLDTLRQLRELLDAGTITPQEFETLKARILAEQLGTPVAPPPAPAAPSVPPTVPLNPTFTTPPPPVASTEPVRPEPVTMPPVSQAPAPGPAEELPPLLDFFKQPQTSGSPTPPPVAPVREEQPAPYTAPHTPPPAPTPAAPTAMPDSFPPRPTPPAPATPTPRDTPQFYPPAPSPPPAAAPPEFFPPRTQTTVSVEPVRPVVPPVPPTPVNPGPRRQAAEPLDDEDEVEQPAKSPLGMILAIGGGLLLLALIWYLVAGQSRSSEHLTSISQTAADTVSVTPETGPQAEQLNLPPAAAPETVRVAPVIPPSVTTDSVATGTAAGSNTAENQATPSASAAASETAPAESASEATDRVRDVLAAYYADIQAPPFNAEQYFAPQVELFVILRNTTPAAISTWLDQNRFAELKDAQFQVEPGSLRVSPPANDGSRVVTYIERGRGFRQSLQKNQYIRAQMRLRLNPDYKITYQKQERLLENTLSDPPTATTPSTTPATE